MLFFYCSVRVTLLFSFEYRLRNEALSGREDLKFEELIALQELYNFAVNKLSVRKKRFFISNKLSNF